MISPPRRSQFNSTVLANLPLCREHFRLVLRAEGFPHTEPGQFVQIVCRDQSLDSEVEVDREWGLGRRIDKVAQELETPVAFLRRPFSLAGRRDVPAGVELDIIHRVVGVGTDWLSRLNTGDTVNIIGPLGNRFSLPPKGGLALLVGGGVGIPPMIYLAEALARSGRRAIAFSGAMTADLLPFTLESSGQNPNPDQVEPQMILAEFSRHGIPSVVSTDDGSFGFRGYITQALERHLESSGFAVPFGSDFGELSRAEPQGRRQGSVDSSSVNPEPRILNPIIYTCGPEPMMKRVAEIAASRGLACQIAAERAMACGMGTCQSCVIRVRTEEAAGSWAYRLACTDGPVFSGSDLMW